MENEHYTEALALLQSGPYKVTKQRSDLLKYLVTFTTTFVPVRQVDHYIQSLYPSASHATTYRNIKEFLSIGLLEQRMEDSQLFVKFRCDHQSPHHGHFICTSCGQVTDITLTNHYTDPKLADCVVLQTTVELQGLCGNCDRLGGSVKE